MIVVHSVETVYRKHYLSEKDEAAVKAYMEATGADVLTAVRAMGADLWYDTEEYDWENFEMLEGMVEDREESHD